MKKLIVAFRSFANAPKTVTNWSTLEYNTHTPIYPGNTKGWTHNVCIQGANIRSHLEQNHFILTYYTVEIYWDSGGGLQCAVRSESSEDWLRLAQRVPVSYTYSHIVSMDAIS
jgi:hypothetical protein